MENIEKRADKVLDGLLTLTEILVKTAIERNVMTTDIAEASCIVLTAVYNRFGENND